MPNNPVTSGIPKNPTFENAIANCSIRCVLPKNILPIINPRNIEANAKPNAIPKSVKISKLNSMLNELIMTAGVQTCKRIVDN